MDNHQETTLLDEVNTKLSRLRLLLERHQVDGILLRRVSSFAWLTGGIASYVNTATTDGAASLLVTHDCVYVLTNNIEAPRLEQEEGLSELSASAGWQLRISPWTAPQTALANLTKDLSLAIDGPLSGARDASAEIARLRASLLPAETNRMVELSRACAEAMDSAARQVQPGMDEQHIAAILAYEVQRRGAQPIVNLIATDERVYRFRHPLPTNKKLERYAMLVLCGRKRGLVTSITRLVHFGPIPQDLERRIQASAAVFSTFSRYTRPGNTLGDIIAQAKAAYASQGYEDEWQRHHQGGTAGYETREYLGLPGSQDMVSVGQAYSWNPSIAGAKTEDTILVGQNGNQNLTATPGWPEIQVPQEPGFLDSNGVIQPIFRIAGPLVL